MNARYAVAAVLLALCCGLTAAQPAPTAAQNYTTLPAFSGVSICWPVNVVIQPNASASDVYDIRVQAERAVIDAMAVGVVNGLLSLELASNFTTNAPIQVLVSMPATALQTINHFGPGADVYVVPGFSNSTLNATTAYGAGQLYVNGGNFTSASVTASGTGNVVLSGTFGDVTVDTTGVGSVFLDGVTRSVDLTLSGISNVFVATTNPSLPIRGTSSGIATVSYNNGDCRVTSPFIFSNTCRAAPFVVTPIPTPTWTCGLKTSGNFTCMAGGDTFTTSAAGGTTVSSEPRSAAISSSSSSSSIGGGQAALTPSSFQFSGASQSQSGQVTPSTSNANAAASGTGSVSSSSVAGPGTSTTTTTVGGQTTTFGTSGSQTTGASTVEPSPGGTAVIRSTSGGQQAGSAATQACVALPSDLRVPVTGF